MAPGEMESVTLTMSVMDHYRLYIITSRVYLYRGGVVSHLPPAGGAQEQ